MAILGVVPAAGLATRLQPLPCSKELLRVGGAPVVDRLVAQLRAGGADTVRLVTRPDKQDLVEHARSLGVTVVLGTPSNVSESVLLGVAGAAPDDVALVGFPDTLWEPLDGFARLVPLVEAGADVALGLFHTEEPERCDVVVLDTDGRVRDIETKVPEPSSNLIWGCFAARVGALDGLADAPEPSVHLLRLVRAWRVASVFLAGEFVDIGTREAMAAAGALAPQGRS